MHTNNSMMKCSSKILDTVKAFAAAAFFMVSVNSCTDVDDSLGYNLIPDNQKMSVWIDTLTGVDTYLFRYDSVSSSGLGSVYFGRENSSVFGSRTNSFIIQFLPTSIPYEGGFGLDPIVDSLYIEFPLTTSHGNTDVEQTFNVYALKDIELFEDSTYYTNFDVSPYIDRSQLLFTFKHKGKNDIKQAMTPTALGREFMESLVTLDTAIYKNDTLFQKSYPGLYFTPADDSPRDAATYVTSLQDAYMVLYVRDHDTIDHALIRDTLSASYYFYDSNDYGNVSINMVSHDYSGTLLGQYEAQTNGFTDTSATSPTVQSAFVQTMGGVSTYVRFSEAIAKSLKGLLKKPGENGGDSIQYSSMLINQARIFFYMDDSSTPNLNAAEDRLGMYLNQKNLTPIPDYLYTTERNIQLQSDADYVLPYNGYLNRSNGYYVMDITSYIQQLMQGSLSRGVFLAPQAYGFFDFGNVELRGSAAGEPIRIVVTYTLIR